MDPDLNPIVPIQMQPEYEQPQPEKFPAPPASRPPGNFDYINKKMDEIALFVAKVRKQLEGQENYRDNLLNGIYDTVNEAVISGEYDVTYKSLKKYLIDHPEIDQKIKEAFVINLLSMGREVYDKDLVEDVNKMSLPYKVYVLFSLLTQPYTDFTNDVDMTEEVAARRIKDSNINALKKMRIGGKRRKSRRKSRTRKHRRSRRHRKSRR
jgi:hypothetical protein